MPTKLNTWECNHCTRTGTFEEVEKHEKVCSFNPENKQCWSCKHHHELGVFGGYECGNGVTITMFEHTEGVPCKVWEKR